jgi:hypothetical protein
MKDTKPWELTHRTCGGHSLTTTNIWSILTGPDNVKEDK